MPSRTPSTPYAILGLLSFAPLSGYDIRKEAVSSIGYFWSESYGQIYPALSRLTSAGWIRRRPSRRGSARERQVYEITRRGRDALRLWVAEPPRASPVRSELLLKLFLSDSGSAGHAIEWLDHLLAEEIAQLSRFRRTRRELLKERRDHASLPFWLITVSYGEYRSRAVVSWCRETLRVLRAAATKGKGKEP